MINSKYHHFRLTLHIQKPQIQYVLPIGVQKHLIQINSPFTGGDPSVVTTRASVAHGREFAIRAGAHSAEDDLHVFHCAEAQSFLSGAFPSLFSLFQKVCEPF